MINNDVTKEFLDALYRMTEGNIDAQISMHEVGASIGLEKTEAGKVAEELMVQGTVELKTLAGGIGITKEGLEVLGLSSTTPHASAVQLSKELIPNENDRATVEQLVKTVKDELGGHQLDYSAVETVVIDIKTIELHLLSPRPKNAVIRELLRSLRDTLAAVKENSEAVATLNALL